MLTLMRGIDRLIEHPLVLARIERHSEIELAAAIN